METKDLTRDGTVDLRGQPVLASKTGKWKACAFLVGTVTVKTTDLSIFLRFEPNPCQGFETFFFGGRVL